MLLEILVSDYVGFIQSKFVTPFFKVQIILSPLLIMAHVFNSLSKKYVNFNPSRPNYGRREKFKFNFSFSHFFVVPQKVL